MTPETLKLEREATSVMHINGLPIVSSASAEISNDSIGEKGNLSKSPRDLRNQEKCDFQVE